MEKLRTLHGRAREGLLRRFKPYVMRAELLPLVAATALSLALLAPAGLFLPLLSPAAIAIAAATALIARASKEDWRGDAITLWDVSGAFALVGCVTAMLSKPETLLPLFGHAVAP